MNTKNALYSPALIARLEKKLKRTRLAAALIATLGLGLCVAFCLLCRPETADRMELSAVLTAIVSGWVLIYLLTGPGDETKKELRHAEMLSGDPEETAWGTLHVEKKALEIRGGVRFCPVTLTGGEGRSACRVAAARAEELRKLEGKTLRLSLVKGFVSGWEVLS